MNIKNHTNRQVVSMALLLFVAVSSMAVALPHVFAVNGLDFPTGNLPLMAPLNGSDKQTLAPQPGIGMFYTYFNLAWPWVLGSAAGIGVLQSLIGGMEIMLSGGDSGKRESGKNKVLYALAGLLMVGLASLILQTINPIGYV